MREVMGSGRQRPARRALVLAGGGIVGGLYEVGALIALDSVWEGFSTRDFDLYVGSSAGAFNAALLANSVSAERIKDALESNRRTLPRLSASRFVSFPWRSYLGTVPRLAAALPRLALDLWEHWDEALVLDTVASLLRVLPRGIFSLDGLERYARTVLTQAGRTNDFRRLRRRLFIPATALDTGAIRVFGARVDERTPISRAVAASAAVPILFEPFVIDGHHYIDAAVTKTAHARLAVERGAGLVVVVNPMRPLLRDPLTQPPLADGGPFAVAGQALRIAIHRRLHDGLARHAYASPATDFVLLEPYERDLRLFDYPLMTYSLRYEVIRRGYRTTVKTILADYERLSEVFALNGVTLRPRREIERRAHRWSSGAGAAAPRLERAAGAAS
jgi:NTE family protein